MTVDPGASIPPPPLPYRDQKTGLTVFGIFEILIGCFFLFSLLASLVGTLLLRNRPEMGGQFVARSLFSTVLLLGGIATVFITLGIGSIKARRWARALSLCLGWIGLAMGLVGCVFLVWALPGIEISMQQAARRTGQELPHVALLVAKIGMVVFTVVFYLVIPGALVLFYRTRHVKLTCEARDPTPRWTDRCPLPVLAIVLIQLYAAVAMLVTAPTYGRAFPLFGSMLTGVPATILYIGFSALSVYLADGLYKLRLQALWLYMVVVVIFATNAVISFSGGKLIAYYEAIGISGAQLQQIKAMPIFQSSSFIVLCALSALLFLGYLWWIKRFFSVANTDRSPGKLVG